MIARVVGLELVGATMTASAIGGVGQKGVLIVEFVVLIVGAWLLVRGKQASQAIANAEDAQKLAGEWRENYLAERQAHDDAEKEALEQRALKHEALTALAASQAQRDLTAVMTALIEIQKTGTRTVELLDKIVRRLDRTDPPRPIQEAA